MSSQNVETPRLKSRILPSVPLRSTDGSLVDLSRCSGISVVYAYPRTSPVDQPPIKGWENIPGAKGCTLQSREFASQYSQILDAGADRVFGLSTQSTDYQAEMRDRLHLPYHILSDEELRMTAALGMPTFKAGGMTLLSRLTMVVDNGRIQHIFFPVVDAEANAGDVVQYLTACQKSTIA